MANTHIYRRNTFLRDVWTSCLAVHVAFVLFISKTKSTQNGAHNRKKPLSKEANEFIKV